MKKLIALFTLCFIFLMMLSACDEELTGFTPGASSGATADNPHTLLINPEKEKSYPGSTSGTWYEFEMTSVAAVDIELKNANMFAPSKAVWTVALYESGSDEILKYYSLDLENIYRSYSLGYLKPGKYLLKVTSSMKDTLGCSIKVTKEHDCEGNFNVLSEPTCTENGIEYKTCLICHYVIESRENPALGHQTTGWTVVSEPTCTQDGARRGFCTVCNADVTESISAGHSFGDWNELKKATCDEPGSEERTCSHCYQKETRETDLLQHRFNDWNNVSGNVIIPPIVREHNCELCGYTETVKDWGYVWVSVLAGITAVGLCIGVVAYIKAYKNP
ncbi:MAG: hypothetical protein IKV40_05195 [Clostridia bacterium]|nr:hypothetical protein [Clostridia bacterium]